MRSDRILHELKLLIVFPLLFIVVATLFFAKYTFDKLTVLHQIDSNIKKITVVADVITELQKERGAGSGYLARRMQNAHKALYRQRDRTDAVLREFHYRMKSAPAGYPDLDAGFFVFRDKVNHRLVSPSEQFQYYTARIQLFFDYYLSLVKEMRSSKASRSFSPYTSLMAMQEALGRLRGSFLAIFSKSIVDDALFYDAVQAKGYYDLAAQRYKAIAPKPFLDAYKRIEASEIHDWIEKRVSAYLLYRTTRQDADMRPWFEKTTEAIAELVALRVMHLHLIQDEMKESASVAKRQVYINMATILFIFLFMAYLGHRVQGSILRQIALLCEYKRAVDRSSIVSKTDLSGRITYANEIFCNISGYAQDELVGKPHNIVRHPEMPKMLFREMWATILDKKPWQGIVKNRKKDGSFYIAEATISPILNHKGEIEEFIAIRNDITEIVTLQSELEETQREIILKMGEIGEAHSEETGFHVKRVAAYSGLLGKRYGLSKREIDHLVMASPMHDIGKVGIPDSILGKPERLTEDEFEIMKRHAEIGYRFFKDSDREMLRAAAEISYTHHEKYDGSGYPRGISGEAIPIYGRITALADVFDALSSRRCYKEAWEDVQIFSYLKEQRGRHFDPLLVDIFFQYLDDFLEIRDRYRDSPSR